jgi:5-methylcytosine-specific restriction endonuclease McrA
MAPGRPLGCVAVRRRRNDGFSLGGRWGAPFTAVTRSGTTYPAAAMARGRKRRPNSVSKALRQEAGFGCCKCGNPIFEYHHIVPYTDEDPHNRVEDMMVLCPNCHDEATRGVIEEPEQRWLKAHPANIREGLASGRLVANQKAVEVQAGGTVLLAGIGPLLSVDGEPLLKLGVGPAGDLRLSIALWDAEANLLALIEENEWVSGDPLPWDIDFDFRRLTIRRRHRDISLDLDLRGELAQIRGRLHCGNCCYELENDGVTWGGGKLAHARLQNVEIDVDSATGATTLRWKGPPAPTHRTVVKSDREKPGRNDSCWCGSGRKFKKCHGS